MSGRKRKTPAVSVTSDRLGGSTVPAPSLSSTDDGLPTDLSARSVGEYALAEGGGTAEDDQMVAEESGQEEPDKGERSIPPAEENVLPIASGVRWEQCGVEGIITGVFMHTGELSALASHFRGDGERHMIQMEGLCYVEDAVEELARRTRLYRTRSNEERERRREANTRASGLEEEGVRLLKLLEEEREARRRSEALLASSKAEASGLRERLEASQRNLEGLRARLNEGSPGGPAAKVRRCLAGERGGQKGGVASPAQGTSPGGGIPPAGGTRARPAAVGDSESDSWTVAGRTRKRRRKSPRGQPPMANRAVKSVGQRTAAAGLPMEERARPGPAGSGRRPVAPRSAAVTVRCTAEGFSYAGALRRAKEEIPLTEMGITGASVRRAADGALLIEVPGPGGGEKADALAERLRVVLPEASVARPMRTGEVRLVGFDESVLPEELRLALSACAGCGPEEVRLGKTRWSPRKVGSIWAKLPLASAIAAAGVGKVELGWSVARIELLSDRPLQCYRCWQFGHMRASCPGPDRGRACYRCGRTGHIARDCAESASCAVCREKGLDAAHRLGGPRCAAAQATASARARRRRRRRGRPPAANDGGDLPPTATGRSSPAPAAGGGGNQAARR